MLKKSNKENIKWKEQNPKYGPMSYNGYVGEWKCFKITWNVFRNEKTWNIFCLLPGIKEKVDNLDDLAECKKVCENVWNYWIGKCKENNNG